MQISELPEKEARMSVTGKVCNFSGLPAKKSEEPGIELVTFQISGKRSQNQYPGKFATCPDCLQRSQKSLE
ncbi:MAG: hypothetical protein ACYCOU_07010 [Sulfobacillus sp.]